MMPCAQAGGFDDIYRVPADIRQAAAILSTPDYRVRLYGDRNGLIIFTAAPQDGTAHDAGTYDALATELQTLPNSLHRPRITATSASKTRAPPIHQSSSNPKEDTDMYLRIMEIHPWSIRSTKLEKNTSACKKA